MEGMEIAEARLPGDAHEIVDFVVKRTPKQDRVILRSELDQDTARSLRVLVAREPDGSLAGVGIARTSANLPAGALFVIVSTREDHGGRGLGSRLYAAALVDPGDEVTRLVACVLDGDHRSLDVAHHWGFERKERSITISCALADAQSRRAAGRCDGRGVRRPERSTTTRPSRRCFE